jgi:hypothetical protein
VEKYFDEWPENTPIQWWNEGRQKLNRVIRIVNRWTLDGRPSERRDRILRHVDMGEQVLAGTGADGDWLEVLADMKRYVSSGSKSQEMKA